MKDDRNWLQRAWEWLNTPSKDMKAFREWKQYVDDRAEGYRAGLVAQHSVRLEIKPTKPEHSKAWDAGFRDGNRQPEQERSRTSNKVRLNGRDFETQREAQRTDRLEPNHLPQLDRNR